MRSDKAQLKRSVYAAVRRSPFRTISPQGWQLSRSSSDVCQRETQRKETSNPRTMRTVNPKRSDAMRCSPAFFGQSFIRLRNTLHGTGVR